MTILATFGKLVREVRMEHLKPVLERHAEFFKQAELKVSGLRNDERSIDRLMDALTDSAESIPPRLLHDLHLVERAAKDTTADRLRERAAKVGLDLPDSDELTSGDLALVVLVEKRDLLEKTIDTVSDSVATNFVEYPARVEKRLRLSTARAAIPTLEERIGGWFGARDRSPVCEIHAYKSGVEVVFHVLHGKRMRQTGTITSKHRRGRTAFRPQGHDVVVYSNKDALLRASASQAKHRELYRAVFGEILFKGDDHFDPQAKLYHLAPLKRGRKSIKPTRGIKSVSLSELWVGWDGGGVQRTKGKDVFDFVEGGKVQLDDGNLIRASFLVQYESGGRARKLELRPDNQALFDRNRDSSETMEFLRKRKFLRRPSDR